MYQDSTPFYHNGFRDMFPTGYGGYLEPDPLGLRAGVFSNGYNYANQNPFKYIDPWGLICLDTDGGEICSIANPLFQQQSVAAPNETAAPPSGEVCTAPAQQSTALAPYYPPNNGFMGQSVSEQLQPGSLIDRYGFPGGRFASPAGTPFYLRGLPLDAETLPFNTYQVLQPLTVQSGTAALAHGLFGGGPQYELPADVQTLIDSGFLAPVDIP
jgi:RHS repeat-associated protein